MIKEKHINYLAQVVNCIHSVQFVKNRVCYKQSSCDYIDCVINNKNVLGRITICTCTSMYSLND